LPCLANYSIEFAQFFFLGSEEIPVNSWRHITEVISRRSISTGAFDNIICDLILDNLRQAELWDGSPILKASSFTTGLVKRVIEPREMLRLIFE
jgi:hypothetical protein